MKKPEREINNLLDQTDKSNEDMKEKADRQLTDEELESVAGGVAPIIKPPPT